MVIIYTLKTAWIDDFNDFENCKISTTKFAAFKKKCALKNNNVH
jgi:hypothetical protein